MLGLVPHGIRRTVPVIATLALTLAPFVLAGPVHAAEPASNTSARAERIVSIGGSVTEIIYALGDGERLVARDTTSMWPEEVNALPDIGYMRALSPEGVLSVDPDAVVALEGSGPPETMEVLSRASVPVSVIPERFDRDGIIGKILAVGEAIGASQPASELAQKVAVELDALASDVSGIGERRRVLFILSMQGGKILAAGTNSAADGIIKLAGADNAVTAFSGYRQLTEEAIVEAAPDFVLMMDREGEHAIDDAGLFAHPALSLTPAAREGAVIRMDGGYLLGLGPRTASAARELSARIYGLAPGQ